MCRTSNRFFLIPQRLHEQTEILVQLGHGKGFPGVCCLPVLMPGRQQPTALHVIPRTQVLLLASVFKSRAPACRTLILDFWILRVRQRHPQRHCETGQYPGQSFKTKTPSALLLTEALICPCAAQHLGWQNTWRLPFHRPAQLSYGEAHPVRDLTRLKSWSTRSPAAE